MSQTHFPLVPRSSPALLSLVIPMFNEEEMIPLLKGRLAEVLKKIPCPVEVILVNDGSTDRTLPLLLEWAKEDARIHVLGLARNFSHQIAATAGLDHARGDAVVLMDADLQDPPEVILDMIAKYCEGYDVVYGRRLSREGEGIFKRFTAWLFYRFMRALVHPDLPADTGDFRLLSRPCLDALCSMRELHRFLRGMVAWVGFAQTQVEYHRPARQAGTTKYPLRKMIRFAWNAVVSFSPLPLRLSLMMGVGAGLLGIFTAIFAIIWKALGYYVVVGWTSQFVLTCLIGGAILISNGILGEYVSRIFEELKNRPLYVVAVHAGANWPVRKHSVENTGRGTPPSAVNLPVLSKREVE